MAVTVILSVMVLVQCVVGWDGVRRAEGRRDERYHFMVISPQSIIIYENVSVRARAFCCADSLSRIILYSTCGVDRIGEMEEPLAFLSRPRGGPL